jgi:hypothetical protein
MSTLHVIKDGVQKVSIPYRLTNGFPNFQGKYLVSKTITSEDGVDPKDLVKKAPTPASAKYYLRLGMNPDGNELIDDEDLQIRKNQVRDCAEKARRDSLIPEQRSREDRIREGFAAYEEIEHLFALSYKVLHHDTDGMNVDMGYRLQAQAQNKAHEWALKYPEAANQRKAQALRSDAAHERDLAVGALTYDCDGSLSREDQQNRHDACMNRASELEVKATELEK